MTRRQLGVAIQLGGVAVSVTAVTMAWWDLGPGWLSKTLALTGLGLVLASLRFIHGPRRPQQLEGWLYRAGDDGPERAEDVIATRQRRSVGGFLRRQLVPYVVAHKDGSPIVGNVVGFEFDELPGRSSIDIDVYREAPQ